MDIIYSINSHFSNISFKKKISCVLKQEKDRENYKMEYNFAEAVDYTGTTATAVGWGQTGEYEPVSNKLRIVNLPILSKEECDQAGYYKHMITENMFCAGYLKGEFDACFVREQSILYKNIYLL